MQILVYTDTSKYYLTIKKLRLVLDVTEDKPRMSCPFLRTLWIYMRSYDCEIVYCLSGAGVIAPLLWDQRLEDSSWTRTQSKILVSIHACAIHKKVNHVGLSTILVNAINAPLCSFVMTFCFRARTCYGMLIVEPNYPPAKLSTHPGLNCKKYPLPKMPSVLKDHFHDGSIGQDIICEDVEVVREWC